MNTLAVLYARYSSDNQRDESIDAQIDAISRFAKQRNFIIIDEYIDRAKTATSDRRPSFQRLIRDSAKGSFSTVLVHRLDRFARNKYDSAIYKQKLKANGVTLVSVTEMLDGSPESVILESVLEGMAEYYSQNLAREVRKGMMENAKKSLHTGGRPALGYDVDPDTKKFIINEREAEAVRLIFDRFIHGVSYSKIVEELTGKGYKTKTGKDFVKNSLYEILVNPKYGGDYVYNRFAGRSVKGARNSHKGKPEDEVVRNVGGCPAIVSAEVFHRAGEIVKVNKKIRGGLSAREKYLLSGIIICGSCGKSMHGNRYYGGHNQEHYYVTYRCSGKGTDHRGQVNVHPLDAFVLDTLQARILNIDSARSLMEDTQAAAVTPSRREVLQSDLADVDAAISNITRAVESGFSELAFRDRLMKLLDEQAALSNALDELGEEEENRPTEKSLVHAAAHFAYVREVGDFFELKRFTRQFIESITIYQESVEIRFKLPNNTPLDLTVREHIGRIYPTREVRGNLKGLVQ